MSNWTTFVRERLVMPQLTEPRQRDLVDEVASQLEEIELEALELGHSEAEAREIAASHIEDWHGFAAEVLNADNRNHRSPVARLAEHSEDRLRGRGGWAVCFADLLQDIHYSIRSLRNSPGFTSIALLTLVLGIAGVTTIFTFYDHVLLRPLPYPESEGLVELWEKMASFENATVSYANFTDWRAQNRVFEDMAVWNAMSRNLSGKDDPVEVTVARISASLPSILRTRPVLGRSFLAEEDTVGGAPVVMLAHRFWQDRFGGDPAIIGQSLSLNHTPYTVVGIMPAGFRFPPRLAEVQLYAPIEQFAEQWIENRSNHPGLLGVARLKPGITLEAAREDMERIAVDLEAAYPDTNTGSRIHVASLHDRVSRRSRDILVVLLLSVALLMLIACFNVANLVLARSSSRAHDMAIRTSMGASRTRIIRLMLIESLVLWLTGAVLGLLLAGLGVHLLSTMIAAEIPWVFQVGLDLRVATLALLVSLATGLVFGIAPALAVSRQDPKVSLIDGLRHTGGVARARFRKLLVVCEVGLAVALLIGAGLTTRSFAKLSHADTGLDPDRLLTIELNLSAARYPDEANRSEFFTRLLDEVRALPGVTSAATAYVVPIGPGGWQNGYHVEGTPPEVGGRQAFAEVNSVSGDYFRTMGIPLISGRDFLRTDLEEAPPIVIVDEGMAARYWPGENPIGKRIKWGSYESENPWMHVVGVAGAVMVNGAVREPLQQMYIPHWQSNDDSYHLMVKALGDLLEMVGAIRRIVRSLDPTQPLGTVETMDAWLAESTRVNRLTAYLMAGFSFAAVLLAAVGVYGVMAQLTAERRREIGVRMALGAQTDQVLALVLRQGLTTVLIGLGLGFGIALFLGRIMAVQLYQVTATDPLTFAVAPLFVALVAAAANLIPARLATKVDPARVLQVD